MKPFPTKMKIYIIFLVLSLHQLNVYSQNNPISFKNISSDEGWLQGDVLCIHQDKLGFIWLGTWNGLIRYDSRKFILFKNNPQQPGSLSNNVVKDIYQDSKGTLWIGTEDGLNIFDYKNIQFINFRNRPDSAGNMSSNNINFIFEDKNSNIWIGTDKGLNLYDSINHSFKSYYIPNESKNTNNFISMRQNSDGDYWIGTQNGLYSFENNQLKKRNILFSHELKWIRDIHIDIQNNIYVSLYDSDGGVVKILGQDNNESITYNTASYPTNLSSNSTTCIYEDSKNNIWIGTSYGINYLSKSTNTIKHLYLIEGDNRSLVSNHIFCIYEDMEKNIWIGTQTGLNLYTEEFNQFKYFKHLSGNYNSPMDKSIRSVFVDKDETIWMGTEYSGMSVLNNKTKKYKHYKHEPDNLNSLPSHCIYDIHQDFTGKFWIATRQGLSCFDPEKETFVNYFHNPEDPNSIGHNRIFNIFENKKNELFIGTWDGGLNLYDREKNNFKRFFFNPSSNFEERSIKYAIESNDGNFWIGNNYGLRCFNPETNNTEWYKKIPDNKNCLSNDIVHVIFEDSKNQIWVGTKNGLNLFLPKNKEFKVFYENDGLASNVILGIQEDTSKFLWISTINGLSKLNIENYNTINYKTDDGLVNQKFNENAFYKDKNGIMYFGTSDGLVYFNPSDIKSRLISPKVVFTDLYLSNKPVEIGQPESPLKQSLTLTKKIVLNESQSVFALEFSAMNFSNPDAIFYSYYMEGFDDEKKGWNFIGNRNSVTFTNLNPGKYTFKVKASNHENSWQNTYSSIDIQILPPWWRTWWAISIYFIIVAMFLSLARSFSVARAHYQHNIKIEKIEREKETLIHQMKLKFFTNVSHELKTPLTLILGPVNMLLDIDKNDKETTRVLKIVRKNALRLLYLINQLMDIRKIETSNMELNLEEANIVSFIEQIKTAFDSIAEENEIQFDFYSNNDEILTLFDKDKIEKIIYNLLSNAFKHTPKGGSILISVCDTNKTNAPNEIQISVEDTGNGIPQEKLEHIFKSFFHIDSSVKINNYYSSSGTGIGLSLVKEFIELHQGTIHVKSNEGEGSKFFITLPYNKTQNQNSSNPTSEKNLVIENNSDVTKDLHEKNPDNNNDITFINKDQNIGLNKYSVLIVEDNPDVRKLIKDCFIENYNVLEAENGKIGLAIACEFKPDAIISDLMMPVMNGIQFCEKIKSDPILSHIPFIILTAYDNVENNLEVLRMGADDYIPKPFNPKIVLSKIENLILQRIRLKELFSGNDTIKFDNHGLVPEDQALFDKILKKINENISDSDFSVEKLSEMVAMSRIHLFRKVKAITGKSPVEIIKILKMKKSAQLLEKGLRISEIMNEVGITSRSYFNKCFFSYFNCTPSDYIKKI